ncbi:aminotransferase class V-fold PLP-dependent enzyme [Alteribacter natronophilus]|uniref:aminotransferase class V-fold PLP-dependent enzyme n=1 Tax=Alteribacter natronophilus TaxID=2583810 RepID=UPI00110F1E87|nr:aminotransferase class V-fold PLP-dependent enzyme [Alteribacter natronophilus]TMW72013.1 aminotransferase class V-fold PLP-dependent enzyme [Alteribacter natronophilus]
MIYLDQAASSFPKPNAVAEAVGKAINEYGANPGRSGHRLARQASETVDLARRELSDFVQGPPAERVLFFQNATQAINQAIFGLGLSEGDHVVATVYEHNAVRRPLEWLKAEKNIEVTYLRPDDKGNFSIGSLKEAVRPETRLVAVTHGSNVTGAVIPVNEWGRYLKDQELFFLVDASQTAGVLDIQMKDWHIDLLAFPGHKGLLGPQGTGVLMTGIGVRLQPILFGGTGSHSADPLQPDVWPEGFQSGTLNTPGIAGLLAGLQEVKRIGMAEIRQHEEKLTARLLAGLSDIPDVSVYYAGTPERLGVVSFSLRGTDVHEVAMILDEHYDIAVRAGFHCAPLAHRELKTEDSGLMRVSTGPYNTEEEIDTFLNALREIREGLAE